MHIRVFNHYIRSPYIFLSLVEFLVLMTCAYLAVAPSGLGGVLDAESLDTLSLQYALIYSVVFMLSTYAMGVYGAGVSEGFGSMMIRSVVSYCLLGAAVMVILYIFVPMMYVGHGVLFGAVSASLGVVLVIRSAFYSLVDLDQLKRRILVLGAGQRAQQIERCFVEGKIVGSQVFGFIGAPDTAQVNAKLVDIPADLLQLAERLRVDEIVVATDERRKDQGSYFPLDQLLTCKMAGIRVTEVVEFYERELARIDLQEVSTSWMVFGGQFRIHQFRDLIKRSLDVLLSLLLILLGWPFMLLTALAVYLESGAPIIYKQQRVGYRGKLFEIYKFRSMRQDAEKDGKAVWAQQNDSRKTKVGSFIRNTRLDELPQVVNVLKGDMSFVGPRPERPEFVKELNDELRYYDVRHQVRPGLMGWAQLKYAYGASVEDARCKLMYDLYYVKNGSLLLDVLIIIQSVEVILLGKGVR